MATMTITRLTAYTATRTGTNATIPTLECYIYKLLILQ